MPRRSKAGHSSDLDQDRMNAELARNLPLFRSLAQNLAAYLFDRSAYLRSLRAYVDYQVEFRAGKWMGGTAFLILGVFFLIGACFALMFSLYQLLKDYTGNVALSAFIVSWVCIFLGFAFLLFSRNNYVGLARGMTYKEWKNKEDHTGSR
ncbi:MAG: hypothetical protein KDK23_05830 [Leptospiraceae bacterium]|nr:hypothetical protein [Leptospiraceae bacterium]